MMAPDTGINQYLDLRKWTNPSSLLQGGYDWDGIDSHAYAGVSIRPNQTLLSVFQKLDEILDNDDLDTGTLRWMYGSNRIAYVIEE